VAEFSVYAIDQHANSSSATNKGPGYLPHELPPPAGTATLTISPPPGPSGWHTSAPEASVDPVGTLISVDGGEPATAPSTISGDGAHRVDAVGADGAILDTEWVYVDTSAPSISIAVPADGTTYLKDGAVDSVFRCDDVGSGLHTCSGPGTFDASIVGPQTFTVHASDNAGNESEETVAFTVVYDFSGFFQPVDNPDALNRVKAGAAVPVRFSLGGYQGLGIFRDGSPTSSVVSCPDSPAVDAIEETVTAGNSVLTYDASTDTYVYIWKTNKSWAKTCRVLTITLLDGKSHPANFTFTK